MSSAEIQTCCKGHNQNISLTSSTSNQSTATENSGRQYKDITYKEHSKTWQFCQGIKAIGLTILTLGFGLCFSDYIWTLYTQALSGVEEVTVLKELPPTVKKADDVVKIQLQSTPAEKLDIDNVDLSKTTQALSKTNQVISTTTQTTLTTETETTEQPEQNIEEIATTQEMPIFDLRHSEFPVDIKFLDVLASKKVNTILLTQPKELGTFSPPASLPLDPNKKLNWIESLRFFLMAENKKGRDIQIDNIDYNLFYFLNTEESVLLFNIIGEKDVPLALSIIKNIIEKTFIITMTDKDLNLEQNLYAIFEGMKESTFLLAYPLLPPGIYIRRKVLWSLNAQKIENICKLAQDGSKEHHELLISMFKLLNGDVPTDIKKNALIFKHLLKVKLEVNVLIDLLKHVGSVHLREYQLIETQAIEIIGKILEIDGNNAQLLSNMFMDIKFFKKQFLSLLTLSQIKLIIPRIEALEISECLIQIQELFSNISHLDSIERRLLMSHFSSVIKNSIFDALDEYHNGSIFFGEKNFDFSEMEKDDRLKLRNTFFHDILNLPNVTEQNIRSIFKLLPQFLLLEFSEMDEIIQLTNEIVEDNAVYTFDNIMDKVLILSKKNSRSTENFYAGIFVGLLKNKRIEHFKIAMRKYYSNPEHYESVKGRCFAKMLPYLGTKEEFIELLDSIYLTAEGSEELILKDGNARSFYHGLMANVTNEFKDTNFPCSTNMNKISQDTKNEIFKNYPKDQPALTTIAGKF
ncbi:MAG: hypothetical protein H0W88_03330 [Parachlamydiaceae bacterium]|nr:hypothetical protein [Parachlamydiaceae bacterium]